RSSVIRTMLLVDRFLVTLLLQSPPLFPYTTLFRSEFVTLDDTFSPLYIGGKVVRLVLTVDRFDRLDSLSFYLGRQGGLTNHVRRSEEHTSELQSRENLVCRLLLEKKKNKIPASQVR